MLQAQKSLIRRIPKLHSYSRLLHQTSKSSTLALATSSSSSYVSPLITSRIIQPLMAINSLNATKSSNAKNDRITKQSYLEFDSDTYSLADDEKIAKYYSSKHDGVERRPYTKEINYLKNILESFSEEKYFDKTDQILKSLSKLVTTREFTDIVNKYLENVSQGESLSLEGLENIITELQTTCQFVTNSRTEAVLLSKVLSDEKTTTTEIKKYLENFEKREIKEILRNMEVIGAENLYKIFDSEFIDLSCIPQELHEVYQEYQVKSSVNQVAGDTLKLQENEIINPLNKKNLSELLPVDSFGLKVIRHSLLGLEPTPESALEFSTKVNEIIKDLDDEQLKEDIRSGKLNHHEVYTKLQTPEQKAAYNDALEHFNYDRQKQIEIRGIEGAKEKWKHDFEEQQKRGDLNLTKGLNAQCYDWLQKMIPAIEKEHTLCKALLENDTSVDQGDKATKKERAFYAPFLIKVDPEKAAVITILELLKLHSTGGVTNGFRAYKSVIAVGKAIETEFRTCLHAQKERKATSQKNASSQLTKLISESLDKEDDLTPFWDNSTRSRVGGVLVSFLMSIAKVKVRKHTPKGLLEDYHPAFYHGMQFIGGQRIGVIKIHSEISKCLTGTSFTESIQPQALPMLVKPKPWASFYGGGGLFTKSGLVRMRDAPETEAYVKAASKRGNLDEVFKGLNVLGSTPWTVNSKVFDVISHYWNIGEEFLSIPPVLNEAKFPSELPENADPKEKLERSKLVYKSLREFASSRSQRCDHNYKLEIARGFIGEKLYFPHNLDFRGRAYPISPHFNHLGGDLTRSLFLFWEGRQLGEHGLDWLKVQLANVYGVDKLSLAGRIQFVNDSMDKVIESAADPLAEDAWWKKAEKPWQALSVCFELAEASKMDDPTKFVSHLPVHQDGTCNGLQHYAALGGDIEGANQVNLNPADKPQDVYTYVAGLVEKRVRADAEAGNEMAKFLQDKIKRKVVKQTVMTNVYGVTFVGAIQQIKKQVSQHFGDNDNEHLYAKYLASQVFASIRELFENAHLIQDWLAEAAKRITKSVALDFGDSKDSEHELHSSSVIWTTPLGLPCVQPYRVHKQTAVKTSVQDIFISIPSGTSAVDSRKQQAGFPPNFIHSLDATHMLMTAAKCGEATLNFASVHDSYWTHAADVPVMNRLIREEFVRLHTTNLVQILKDEFVERYKGCYQKVRIPNNHELSKKIKIIKKAWATTLQRKITIADELYMERKRLQMLESEKPEEVEAAKSMETTISVALEYDCYGLVDSKAASAFEILVPLQFPEIPKKGTFDVNLVKQSQYFFS
ncbi:RPO41 DNA-directed RNA polymerase [Candida maltosa Xu316]|uniref:DNA-directed RNA polymerase n=1 Tax=Candida maltosa (strain Xu316) TaxID=1245528 RepID=M3IK19_CANMX|nr:DNA-directed RNA polymerase [Candida maltosa Xu316]